MPPKPLSHFRVLEVSGEVATRFCGRMFAQLGAAVTRLAGGDDRRLGYAGAAGEAYGLWLDQDKTLVTALDRAHGPFDLVIGGQTGEGVEAARRTAAALAGDPALLAVTWFDAAGPYGAWRGTDEVIAALNGAAYSFGPREGPPNLAQGHAPQITAGVVAFNAALAALLAPPDRRPREIAVNVFEAALCFAETGAMSARVDGGVSRRMGVNRYVPTYPCASYPTKDGWVGITCLTPAQWASMCGLIGRPELALDPRFATAYQRLMHADEVDALLAPHFPARTTDEWVAIGDAARIPTAPMPEPAQLPHVPHWRDRGAFAPVGALMGPTLPYRFVFEGETRPRWAPGAAEGPLSGLKVVDFAMGWAGPLCARTLGDLGAEVVKIESEGHPDWWRGWEAGSVDPKTRENKHNFLAVNRNKRGVDLDLTTPQGLASARALIAEADVVVENFAAGVLRKLGLGPDVQRRLNPAIISLSMPAFGNDGPLSGIRAYGSTVEQASGMPFVNGEADWPPALQHIAFGDPVAGLFGASAVLAALAGRERLGGARIDLAQVACLFQIGADAILAAQIGQLPRTGSRRARLALCAVVRGAGTDAWLAVAADDLGALAAVVGGETEAALAAWALPRTPAAAAALLQAAGVAAAPVQPAHSLGDDPQLRAGGFWDEMERAFVGRHMMCAAPFRFDGVRPALRLPAPTLGEHTAEVLAALG